MARTLRDSSFDSSKLGAYLQSPLKERDFDVGVPAWFIDIPNEGAVITRRRGREGDLLFAIGPVAGSSGGRAIKVDNQLAMYRIMRFSSQKHDAAQTLIWSKTDGSGDNLNGALNRDGSLLYEVGVAGPAGKDTFKRDTSDGTKLASAILSPGPSARIEDVAIDDDGLVYVVFGGFGEGVGPTHTPARLIRVDANLGNATTLFTLKDHTGNSTARLGQLTSVDVDISGGSGRIIINGHDDENGNGTSDVDTWLLDEDGTLVWKKLTGATATGTTPGAAAIEKGGDIYTAGDDIFKLARATGSQIWTVTFLNKVTGLDAGQGVVVAAGNQIEAQFRADSGVNIYNKPPLGGGAIGTAIRTNH